MKHGRRFWIGALVAGVLAAALALLAAGVQGALAADGVIRVDAGATGIPDGESWETAYTDLQDALDAAASGDQIWVAAGTYRPTEEHGGTGDRFRSFQMANGVAIYGGFAGTETELGQRNWGDNVTILSGDIGTEGDDFDNSYHVFYHPYGTGLDSSAILDGFTISGGNADGDYPHEHGGGMFNIGSSPTTANVTFAGNSAARGGGMFNDNGASPMLTNCTFELNEAGHYGGGMVNWHSSSPMLSDCIFEGNSAGLYGGGMWNVDYSSPTLANCTFAGNSAVQIGGGMYNSWYSSPTLTNCTFEDNSADWFGGAMMNDDSSPTLTNCTFAGNSANYGGAMAVRWSSTVLTNCIFAGNSASQSGGGMYSDASTPTLTNCTFTGNSANYGGGMVNWEGSSPTLTNCTFASNSANYGGGMMNNENSAPALTNCTFFGNSAGSDGGGMCNSYLSSPTLTNCTFSGNSAVQNGGGMYNWESLLTLTNSILWGDSPQEIYNSDSTPVVTYSDVQGGYEGVGNIDLDPLFVDAANGDLHLGTGSWCIDVGDNYAPNLPLHDFEGDDRILDGNNDGTAIVDMGADEFVPGGPPALQVEIDIRPDSDQNVINLGSGGVVPVAILTTDEFDATTVRPASVLFAGAAPRRWTKEDVDRDGDLDLLLNFKIQDLVDLDKDSTEATLRGETFPHYGEVLIKGTDAVRMIDSGPFESPLAP